MNISGIQSIQIQQGSPRARDNNVPAAPASPTSAESLSVSRAVEGQLQGVLNTIDTMKQQLDLITVYDPPFFPIGVPVRADWINKLNNAQDEAAKASSKTGDKNISFTPQKLKENAADAEIVDSIQKLAKFRKEAAQIFHAATKSNKPGAFVSLRV